VCGKAIKIFKYLESFLPQQHPALHNAQHFTAISVATQRLFIYSKKKKF